MLCVWVLLGLLAGTASAEAPAVGAGLPKAAAEPGVATWQEGNVTPPALPTRVEVGLYVLGVPKISSSQDPFPKFAIEAFLDLRWQDPRLAFSPREGEPHRRTYQNQAAQAVLAQNWSPDISFENGEGRREVESSELFIEADGQVEYGERFSVTLHAEVDLRRFPFDSQRFVVSLESFAWDARFVELVAAPEKSGLNPGFHTLEWRFVDFDWEAHEVKEVRSSSAFSRLDFRIHGERIEGFYLWKIALPLLLIVLFSWSVFWMRHEPGSGRMQRTYIGLLTVVAFHHIVSANLPRIAYLTFLDGLVQLAFASIGLTLVQVVTVHRLVDAGRIDAADRLDRVAQIAMPAGCLLALLVLWFAFH